MLKMFNKYFVISMTIIGFVLADDNDTSTSSTYTTPKFPTTTGAPYIPSNEPQTNLYTLKYADGRYCLMFKAAIRLGFKYQSFDDDKTVNAFIEVPSVENGTHVLGNCTPNDQKMVLKFLNNWNLEFLFKMNSTIKHYYLEAIKIHYIIKHNEAPFPRAKDLNSTDSTIVPNDDWVKELWSYMCYSQRVFLPTNTSKSPQDGFGLINVTIINEQYQAFVNVSESVFSLAVKRCDQDNVSNLIPIVVGAALCTLIVIVLVAYLIGRRHKRGYESV